MRISNCAFVVAAALTATAALAQQSPQPAPAQPMHGPTMGQGAMDQGMAGQGMMSPGMMSRGMMPMMGLMNPTKHIEGRLAFLKTELKITDAQMPQWNAFADALRSNAKRMGNLMAAGHGTMPEMMSGQAGMPRLPERIERAE